MSIWITRKGKELLANDEFGKSTEDFFFTFAADHQLKEFKIANTVLTVYDYVVLTAVNEEREYDWDTLLHDYGTRGVNTAKQLIEKGLLLESNIDPDVDGNFAGFY
jgi:hypothetical protein